MKTIRLYKRIIFLPVVAGIYPCADVGRGRSCHLVQQIADECFSVGFYQCKRSICCEFIELGAVYVNHHFVCIAGKLAQVVTNLWYSHTRAYSDHEICVLHDKVGATLAIGALAAIVERVEGGDQVYAIPCGEEWNSKLICQCLQHIFATAEAYTIAEYEYRTFGICHQLADLCCECGAVVGGVFFRHIAFQLVRIDLCCLCIGRYVYPYRSGSA